MREEQFNSHLLDFQKGGGLGNAAEDDAAGVTVKVDREVLREEVGSFRHLLTRLNYSVTSRTNRSRKRTYNQVQRIIIRSNNQNGAEGFPNNLRGSRLHPQGSVPGLRLHQLVKAAKSVIDVS